MKNTDIEKIKAETAEIDRRLTERLDRVGERLDRIAERQERTDKQLADVAKQFGDIGNRDGAMAEEEFTAALRDKMAVGKHRLQEVMQNLKHHYEYDLVGINGKSVFVGEIKYHLTKDKVRDFAANRLPHFAKDFPQDVEGRKVYGMVGGMQVDADAKRAAKELNLILLRLKNRALTAENAATARPV